MKFGSMVRSFLPYGEDRYNKMRRFGFLYADLNVEGTLEGRTEEAFHADLLREKALADAAGVTIWQIHGPWRHPPHDETPENRAERMDAMKRSIRAAEWMGCRNWVIHPLMPFGSADDFNYEAFLAVNRAFFRDLLPYAKEHGVTVCLENMPMKHLSIAPPAETLRFVREMNDPNFRMCLDTGHSNVRGVAPADAVRLVGKEYLRVLHVHDNHGDRDEHLVPYCGTVDWKAFREALEEIGFEGVVSFEVKWGDFMANAAMDTKVRALRAAIDEMLCLKD